MPPKKKVVKKRGGKRPGAGRKKGSRNTLPQGQAKAIRMLTKALKSYGDPAIASHADPIAYIRSKGLEPDPVRMRNLEVLFQMAWGNTMPRNALTKLAAINAINELLDLRPAPKPQEHVHSWADLVEEATEEEDAREETSAAATADTGSSDADGRNTVH